ncbi:hypothetical protein D3C72_1697860 [compost metagenome]
MGALISDARAQIRHLRLDLLPVQYLRQPTGFQIKAKGDHHQQGNPRHQCPAVNGFLLRILLAGDVIEQVLLQLFHQFRALSNHALLFVLLQLMQTILIKRLVQRIAARSGAFTAVAHRRYHQQRRSAHQQDNNNQPKSH